MGHIFRIKVPDVSFRMNFSNQASMYLRPVSEVELIKQIASLKNDCAPGKDGITAKLIKMIDLEIISPSRHIINLIFKTGKVPSHFKQSVIVPIYKSGSKNEIKNYRPISLINNFTKIFEKVLKNRLIQFYTTFNVLSKFQFGFLANCSTLDAMYSLTSEVVKSLNSNKKSIAIFIDLAKAFDTVPQICFYKCWSLMLKVFYYNKTIQIRIHFYKGTV